MSEVVNVQDKSGNTALNLVARIGVRPIINQLDELGADFSIANHAGFRPTDFGVFSRCQQGQQSHHHQMQQMHSSNPSQTITSPSQAKSPNKIEQIREEIFASRFLPLVNTRTQLY